MEGFPPVTPEVRTFTLLDTIKKNWEAILERYREEKELTNVSYRTWILPLQPVAYENGVLTVLFPGDQTSTQFVEKRYASIFPYIIEEVTGISCKVAITSNAQPSRPRTLDFPSEQSPLFASHLNSRYTFDTFVVGNSNKLAHAAALAVAESPADVYNPLFIYGGSGLGKTHLMQSIAHFILKEDPAVKVLYVTCEKFTNELIDAIRLKTTAEFREKYRNIDVLLIDDIQFISGKESTQLEIFHTFNALYESKKQIVLSSDRPPKEIESLEERLRSRFSCGLTVDIGLPDYETRMAILRKKEEVEGYHIDSEIIKYIATNIKSNIRELEGALTKVVATSRLSARPLTLDGAIEALKDNITPDEGREISLSYLLDVVCEHYNVSKEDVFSSRRDQNIVLPRQVFMYLGQEVVHFPGTSIGKFLNKDHSTIIHGSRKIEKQLATDRTLQTNIEVIRKKLSV